jgi:pimeloyl-ACP methyl ester carboxylesterase
MRLLVAFALVSISLVAAPIAAQQHQRTYVLVHGAWGGGWDWRAVDSLLTARGNRVVRVTLTGQGERVHLASPAIGLATHITDVVNTILWERLHDVVLVGHSYGGMVVTGVVDQIPDRIRRVVYVDAFLPDSGETVLRLVDTARVTFLRSQVRDGMIVPPWVTDTTAVPRDVSQSFRTFTDTLRLRNPAGRRVPGTYILTVEPAVTTPDQFQPFADRAADRGWPVYQLQADHNAQRSAIVPLVDLLAKVP